MAGHGQNNFRDSAAIGPLVTATASVSVPVSVFASLAAAWPAALAENA